MDVRQCLSWIQYECFLSGHVNSLQVELLAHLVLVEWRVSVSLPETTTGTDDVHVYSIQSQALIKRMLSWQRQGYNCYSEIPKYSLPISHLCICVMSLSLIT